MKKTFSAQKSLIILSCSVSVKSSGDEFEKLFLLLLLLFENHIINCLFYLLGSVIEGTQTVMWSRAEFHETTQSEKLCLEVLPSKAAQQDYHMPDVIAVRVQMGKWHF